jgi:hypothetical protein
MPRHLMVLSRQPDQSHLPLILVSRAPLSGGPSQLFSLPDDAVWELDASWGAPEALGLLCVEVGGAAIQPGVNCRGVFTPLTVARPQLPPGESELRAGACALGAGRHATPPKVANSCSPCPFIAGLWLPQRLRLQSRPKDRRNFRGCKSCVLPHASHRRALLPTGIAGRLTAALLCQVVAALQPEGAITVDEALTSGGAYWEAAKVRFHGHA